MNRKEIKEEWTYRKIARKMLIKALSTFQDLIKAYYISKHNKVNEKVHWYKTH